MSRHDVAPARHQEIAANLAVVRRDIAEAARVAGRSANDITLIAVTKTWPSSDVQILAELGVRDVGENKAQELVGKAAQLEPLDVTWHFVGQLQRNKVKQVVPIVDMVHSVDRPALVTALDTQVAQLDRSALKCLVQVNLDAAEVEGRAGVRPPDALTLADQIAKCDHLELAGVMGVAPLAGDAAEAFHTLAQVSAEIADSHTSATVISAGMSGDFVAAIAAGATHVRLGAVLLGERRILR